MREWARGGSSNNLHYGPLRNPWLIHRTAAQRSESDDRPVYQVPLRPEDGLYLLPHIASQAASSPWEGGSIALGAPLAATRPDNFADAG